ncbi:MAG TPA: methyltransferase domain-containing protein [Candidatus Dormibacteraeota bacterium]|nr:methyltransferase domain-containing protein [Candidatus Dormibacteraeota bacterium]
MPSLDESYDSYPRIEEPFQEALDTSLNPRGPDFLYELVERLDLPASATVADVGCGEGKQAIELAERFGFIVTGVDPVSRNIELCNERLREHGALRDRVRFVRGAVESLPIDDGSVQLVWCRDVFSHTQDLDQAFKECRRVLRPGGHMLLYQMFATQLLAPEERDRVFGPLDVASWDPTATESATARAGLRVDETIDLGSEWGEYAEEHGGVPARKLLHAARLGRDPERYIEQFGKVNYDIKLADCLWHVYRMIGKLSGRVYLMSRPR